MKPLDFDRLGRDVARYGGLTIDLDGRQPTAGYAVALDGHEQIVRHVLGHLTVPELADALYSYVIAHGRVLRDPGAHLGAWLDGRRLVLDVSHVIADRLAAEGFGRANGQRSIFNLATGETIDL